MWCHNRVNEEIDKNLVYHTELNWRDLQNKISNNEIYSILNKEINKMNEFKKNFLNLEIDKLKILLKQQETN